jgi:hypothetical protein
MAKIMLTEISGWVFVICFGLILALEPKEPKKDGRFKTGYKNNARVPIKSRKTKRLQKTLLIFAGISGFLWYLSKPI